jgi:hypothetical protein
MTNMDRAPHAYRMGFWDATANRPFRTEYQDGIVTPFAGHDYAEGYAAGFNELYWDAVLENKRRDAAKKRED